MKILYDNIREYFDKGRYSSGRRGGPAKAVGRATGARVQIPLFPPLILLTYQMHFGGRLLKGV